jgi:hypothetical protein
MGDLSGIWAVGGVCSDDFSSVCHIGAIASGDGGRKGEDSCGGGEMHSD